MALEIDGKGFDPEAHSNRYSQIPDLVRRSIVGFQDTRSARRAKESLLGKIRSDRYFDPVLIVVNEAQHVILETKDKKGQLKRLEFIRDVFRVGFHQGEADDEFREELVLRTSDQVVDALGSIVRNDKRIQSDSVLRDNLPNNYILTVDAIPGLRGDLQIAKEGNVKEVKIPLIGHKIQDSSHLEQVRQEGNRYNEWLSSLTKLTLAEGNKDEIIDIIKKEPDHLGQEKTFTRKFAGVSIQDIESMEYPLSKENFAKIAAFLTEAIGDRKLSSAELLPILTLFFLPTYFQNPTSGPIDFRNKKLLANFNSWQELFADSIVFSKSPKIDEQLKNFFERIKAEDALSIYIFMPIASSISSHLMEPENLAINVEELHALSPRHPILAKAIESQISRSQEQGLSFNYVDEMVHPYLCEIVLPLLERRLDDFGVGEKFQNGLNLLRRILEEHDFAAGHLNIIKESFERNSGSGFIEKIKLHTKDIQDITGDVWENLLKNFHFLPMREGLNVVEFSEGSVPSILGLKSLKMIRVGSEQDWKINISFALQNSPFELFAYLDQDGKLEFRAPVEQEIPGLYTMLNHIAVLTFHDLVVQEKKEKESGTRQPRSERNGKPENRNKVEADKPDKIYSRDLPRLQQTDHALIEDVYVSTTGRKPRTVEIHTIPLGRRENYLDAVVLYEDTVNQENVSPDEIAAATELLEAARKRMYKISEQKRVSVPAKLPLKTKQDPATKEQLYLETWVVEHTSPKPTEEELKSPVKLYQRYYRNSSALASLDQMKAWFIGE